MDIKRSFCVHPGSLSTCDRWHVQVERLPQLGDDFHWVNVWSPMDPVSGPLRLYRLDDQDRYLRLGPRYALWGVAHLAYWGDEKFYRIMADRFL